MTDIEAWRHGPRKHVARHWYGPRGENLVCKECDWETGHEGTLYEKEERFRDHRISMGEAVKPQRAPNKKERLAAAEAEIKHLRAALTRITSWCGCEGTDCAAGIARVALTYKQEDHTS